MVVNSKSKLYDRGRWYDAFLESDGSDATITTIDEPINTASISGGYFKLPADFHVIDYLLDINLEEVSSAVTVNKGIRQYADGTQGILIPAVANYSDCYVSIFGYFE